jgi:hypothetical protein
MGRCVYQRLNDFIGLRFADILGRWVDGHSRQ